MEGKNEESQERKTNPTEYSASKTGVASPMNEKILVNMINHEKTKEK